MALSRLRHPVREISRAPSLLLRTRLLSSSASRPLSRYSLPLFLSKTASVSFTFLLALLMGGISLTTLHLIEFVLG